MKKCKKQVICLTPFGQDLGEIWARDLGKNLGEFLAGKIGKILPRSQNFSSQKLVKILSEILARYQNFVAILTEILARSQNLGSQKLAENLAEISKSC